MVVVVVEEDEGEEKEKRKVGGTSRRVGRVVSNNKRSQKTKGGGEEQGRLYVAHTHTRTHKVKPRRRSQSYYVSKQLSAEGTPETADESFDVLKMPREAKAREQGGEQLDDDDERSRGPDLPDELQLVETEDEELMMEGRPCTYHNLWRTWRLTKEGLMLASMPR